jgi:hypothetical protein
MDVSKIFLPSNPDHRSDQTIHCGGFCLEPAAVPLCLCLKGMAFDLFCSMNHFVSKHIVVIFKWPEEILIHVGVTSEYTLIARDVNAFLINNTMYIT